MRSRTILSILVILAVVLAGGAAAIYYSGMPKKSRSPSASQSTTEAHASENTSNDASTSTATTTKQLKIYYIALEDGGGSGGAIGCGDSIVPVTTEPVTSTDYLKDSINRLLSAGQYYGESGLYNALYQSDLTYSEGHTDGSVVSMTLTGTLHQSGECDAPRIQAQLERTAIDATGTKTAAITLNGKPLSEALSLR